MPLYDLYNTSTGAYIKSRSFSTQPTNPNGKPWAWKLHDRPAPSSYYTTDWDDSIPGWAKTPVDVSTAKDAKLNKLAAYRFTQETAGVTVGAMTIDTSRDSQSLIDATQGALIDGIVPTVKFKSKSGAILDLNASAMTLVRSAVVVHVQTQREKEADHAEAIKLLTTTTAVELYDFEGSAW